IQSHSYWHPNFRIEKRRLSADAYQKFVKMQLDRSKNVLEKRLGVKVDMLAWPFGIYDPELIAAANAAGYRAAFTIERRDAAPGGDLMAIPRYIVTDRDTGKTFERLLR
ncbi:MAG TPA: polysaccharide deacetylase family protein, partial [Candidatus Binataceae bacterium]|nr:polysaccharide deacetylase family protein [Candidatus Binataceae bacterium]